jgi:hypothetical protein
MAKVDANPYEEIDVPRTRQQQRSEEMSIDERRLTVCIVAGGRYMALAQLCCVLVGVPSLGSGCQSLKEAAIKRAVDMQAIHLAPAERRRVALLVEGVPCSTDTPPQDGSAVPEWMRADARTLEMLVATATTGCILQRAKAFQTLETMDIYTLSRCSDTRDALSELCRRGLTQPLRKIRMTALRVIIRCDKGVLMEVHSELNFVAEHAPTVQEREMARAVVLMVNHRRLRHEKTQSEDCCAWEKG